MLKLMSLNLERSRHLGRVLPFLENKRPDVVCLQEVMTCDLEKLGAASGLEHRMMAPMTQHPHEVGRGPHGLAILSRYPLLKRYELVYAGSGDGGELFDRSNLDSKLNSSRYVVALATVETATEKFSFGTTHFPWTPDGKPRDFQFDSAQKITEELADNRIILTGDFNAPRGGPIFASFANQWKDWIPLEIKTSIDPRLHRAGALELMVDGLFTSEHYRVEDVELYTGLSDHQAILASIHAAADQ